MQRLSKLFLVFALAVPVACGPVDGDDDAEWFDEGRDDSWTGGVPDPGASAYVWNVTRSWTDRAPNGETYEEYYATWLATIQHNSSGRDVHYVLADGTVVPAPSLECADTAQFLRFLYASEHGLPWFIRAGRYYFGHFGWLDTSGNPVRTYNASRNAPRGSDATLAASNRYRPNNLQAYPHSGATIGAYLDAVLTNKRLGHFLQDLWNMTYSGNIAENINTFYIQPRFIRGGDLQLHRYDSTGGIGHTITIQKVVRSSTDRLIAVSLIQSYMPTLPWVGNGYSELTNYSPDPSNGGGLRRWRRPVSSNGRWYLVGDDSVAAWARDVPDNPARFAELFSMNAEDEVAAMIDTIDTRRRALFDNPNSCRRRQEREEAFESLYDLYAATPELYRELGFGSAPTVDAVRPLVDRLHRTVDDFVWSELSYQTARTCHWNPSDTAVNNDMYRATIEFNRAALGLGGCRALRIFRAEDAEYCAGRDGATPSNPAACASVPDGFQDLRSFADDNGYSWADYRNDEAGALGNVDTDGLADPRIVEYFCSIFEDLGFWSQP